jgi:ammonium transporter, Amt family
MGTQLAAATVCAAWAFTISCILLFIIDRIPGCHIRASEEEELMGLDAKYLSDVDSEMLEIMGLTSGSGVSSIRAARATTIRGEGVSTGEKTVQKTD